MKNKYKRTGTTVSIQQHNELANHLLSFGSEHYIGEMRFRTLAKQAKETKFNSKGKPVRKKRFGKSIFNKAPALFVKTIKRKVLNAGGSFQKVDTFSVKASQFNHLTETYTKKSLGKRWNTMPDGTKVQRDLYSAFLIQNVRVNKSTKKRRTGNSSPTYRGWVYHCLILDGTE